MAAIGSDLDGGFGREQSPADLDTISDLQKIPEILSDRGYQDEDIAAILHGFAAGLVVLRAPWSLWGRVALRTVLLAGLTAWSFQLVNQAFGIDLPFHTTFLIITFLVVGESIPTPGLVGGFHAFYLLALSEVYGVDRNVAAAASIAAHAFTNMPYLLVGAGLLGAEGLTVRRAVHVSEADLGR